MSDMGEFVWAVVHADEDLQSATRRVSKARVEAEAADGRCTCRFDEQDGDTARRGLAEAISLRLKAEANLTEAVKAFNEARGAK